MDTINQFLNVLKNSFVKIFFDKNFFLDFFSSKKELTNKQYLLTRLIIQTQDKCQAHQDQHVLK